MPKNILIASLGEHPAAVTAMVKALRHIANIQIDVLQLLYPQDTGRKYIDGIGSGQIEDFLQDQCEVLPVPLPFSDSNTRETSMQFLQALAAILRHYQDETTYTVYLSLASGRKNMAALMALVAQFFPSVKGLYHLLDQREGTTTAAFPSIEEMELTMSASEQRAALDPPLDQLKLISIPYPGAFLEAQSRALWQFISDPEQCETLALSVEAKRFFQEVFQPQLTEPILDVWLSSTAMEQYEKLGNEDAERFRLCFLEMQHPTALRSGAHHREDDLRIYKRTHRQRPLFYTTPNDIMVFPQRPVTQVIICGLSIEYAKGFTGPYEPDIRWQLEHASREPYISLADLNARERILLVPLGQSPMIVTQTYTLLRESVAEGQPKIPLVAVIYPKQSGSIGDSVRLLRKQFKQQGVHFCEYPIEGIRDVDSTEACHAYLQTMLTAIENLRDRYPDQQIALSLSGGRKGMSALTLFAAECAGITQVYHTLIKDAELERCIEEETTIPALRKLSDAKQAQKLFLEEYDKSAFELFSIPVIPLQI